MVQPKQQKHLGIHCSDTELDRHGLGIADALEDQPDALLECLGIRSIVLEVGLDPRAIHCGGYAVSCLSGWVINWSNSAQKRLPRPGSLRPRCTNACSFSSAC